MSPRSLLGTWEPRWSVTRRYGKRLYRFGVQMLGNTGLAEDMVQETFVRLWRTAGRFDAEKASVGTYLYVIARSVAADIRKRPSSRPLLMVEDIDVPLSLTALNRYSTAC